MKNKHLSLNNRIDIEKYLNNNFNFTEIGKLVDKATSTISNEVKSRRQRIKKRNPYANSKDYICPILTKPPFVCNGCSNKISCRKTRYEYYAKDADANYRNTLVNSRIGIDTDAQTFNTINNLINEGVSKGHSFYMIRNMNKDKINCSHQTLYNYLHKGYLDIGCIDLPRQVRYKQRSKKQEVKVRNLKFREGRTYQDFLNYKEQFFIDNGYDASIVQMDTVEGIKGDSESCLLTLLFVQSNFLLAFKMKYKTITCVRKAFDYIKERIGYDLFSELFQIILTDNGSEFFDPDYIEFNGTFKHSKLFYCEPRKSQQKGSLEVTHEYIRRFIPKGKSFNPYSQKQITLMVNYINSIPRNKYKGLCAFQIQEVFSPTNFFTKLGLKRKYALEIDLKSSLLKSKKDTNK